MSGRVGWDEPRRQGFLRLVQRQMPSGSRRVVVEVGISGSSEGGFGSCWPAVVAALGGDR
jgi:hypothetical protein